MLIAQISDPHCRPEGRLYQNVVDSNADLAAAVRHLNALDPRPDLVLLSGDVVDEGAPAEYAMARALLEALEIPLYVIPGNHDRWADFRLAFSNHAYLPAEGPFHYVIEDRGPIRIVALDVTLPGLHHGDLDPAAIDWLRRVLARDASRPTMLMMHQPPFACGVPYLDLYLCRNGDRLAEVVGDFPAVERIVCGHVHRHMLLRFAGTTLCTAPSTTTTIDLRLRPDARPASYHAPAACLLHHWRPEVGLVTHLSLIGDYAGPFPFA